MDVSTTLPVYPKVNPAFVPVEVDRNEIHFKCGPWSGPVFRIRDTDSEGELTEILSMLTGEYHVDDVCDASSEPDETERMIEHLYRKNVLLDASESETPVATTNRFFGIGEADTDVELGTTEVLLVTDGPLGEFVLDDLVDAGVGRVRVIDSPNSDGEALTCDDSSAAVVSRTDLDRLEEALSIVDVACVTATSSGPAVIQAVNDAAQSAGTPFLVGRVQGFDGVVGPTVIPGETACYRCYLRRRDAALSSTGERWVSPDSPGPRPVIRPLFRVVAGYVSYDLLNQLSGGFAYTAGRIIHHDFYNLSIESNDVLRLPDCHVCRSRRQVGGASHTTIDDLLERIADRQGTRTPE